jgi:hypothetical protein
MVGDNLSLRPELRSSSIREEITNPEDHLSTGKINNVFYIVPAGYCVGDLLPFFISHQLPAYFG